MTLHYRILPDVTGVDLGPVFPLVEPLPRTGRIAADPLRVPAPRPVYEAFGKRALDVVLASLALVLSLPVLVLLMLALWIEGGKPVFGGGERPGLRQVAQTQRHRPPVIEQPARDRGAKAPPAARDHRHLHQKRPWYTPPSFTMFWPDMKPACAEQR